MATPRMLFVYGTLMSGARSTYGAAERLRLDSVSRVMGPTTIEGHLFDLGSYPGLVLKLPDRMAPARVHGELRELAEPDAVFAWLDAYEGMGCNDSRDDLYRRELRDALVTGAGRVVPAWVYVYQGPLASARLLSDGHWRV